LWSTKPTRRDLMILYLLGAYALVAAAAAANDDASGA